MRINQYIAHATGISRRAADTLVASGRVSVNGEQPSSGQNITDLDSVLVDGKEITKPASHTTIMLHKPTGYVCSRDGQGSKTIYELLPPELSHLKPIGRLDKDTSGLLLLTTDGALTQQLTHPSFRKQKVYHVLLSKPLRKQDFEKITASGVDIDDGKPSTFELRRISPKTRRPFQAERDFTPHKSWQATLREGRNRQIRKTFEQLGYSIIKLHRTTFDTYQLGSLKAGTYTLL